MALKYCKRDYGTELHNCYHFYRRCYVMEASMAWSRAKAQAEVDHFHATNEIGIEGETLRAVAPIWQRWDWHAFRLADTRDHIFGPDREALAWRPWHRARYGVGER